MCVGRRVYLKKIDLRLKTTFYELKLRKMCSFMNAAFINMPNKKITFVIWKWYSYTFSCINPERNFLASPLKGIFLHHP